MGQQSESIGIALEVGNVVPELMAHLSLQIAARPLGEESLDGFLARVPKRGISHIVSQTGRRHDLADFIEQSVF